MQVTKFEGPAGSGKTRQLMAAKQEAMDNGYPWVFVVGSTATADSIVQSVALPCVLLIDECPTNLLEDLKTAYANTDMIKIYAAMSNHEPPEHVVAEKQEQLQVVQDAAIYDAGYLLQEACHSASVAAHWWTDMATGNDLREECRSGTRLGKALVAEKLALIHSEASEAMEGHRKGLMDDKLPDRPAVEVELADLVIRVCDLAGALGLDLGGALAAKMAYNRNRPDHKPEARKAAGGKAY